LKIIYVFLVQDKAKLELYYIEKVDLKVAKLDEKIQVAEKDRHIEVFDLLH